MKYFNEQKEKSIIKIETNSRAVSKHFELHICKQMIQISKPIKSDLL